MLSRGTLERSALRQETHCPDPDDRHRHRRVERHLVEPTRIVGASAPNRKSSTLSDARTTAISRRAGTTTLARGWPANSTPSPTTMKQMAVIGDMRFGWTVPFWPGGSWNSH